MSDWYRGIHPHIASVLLPECKSFQKSYAYLFNVNGFGDRQSKLTMRESTFVLPLYHCLVSYLLFQVSQVTPDFPRGVEGVPHMHTFNILNHPYCN